jgi:hypothetical protein
MKESQLWFKIPNQDARAEFVEAALDLLNMTKDTFVKMKSAVMSMLTHEDIIPLCQVIRKISQENRGPRDAIQTEDSFHQSS